MSRDTRSESSAEARQTPGAYCEGSAGRLQGEAHATRQKFDTHVGFSGDAHTAAALAQSFGPFAIGANFPGFAHCSPELPSDM
jgi:hypothetical protein